MNEVLPRLEVRFHDPLEMNERPNSIIAHCYLVACDGRGFINQSTLWELLIDRQDCESNSKVNELISFYVGHLQIPAFMRNQESLIHINLNHDERRRGMRNRE